MPTVARARSILSLALAPLRWVERARGRRRFALLALYTAVAAGVGLLAARQLALRRLPAVGDPFDVAAFLAATTPPERDAAPLYRLAAARLRLPTATELDRYDRLERALRGGGAATDPALRSWLAENRGALDLWRQATERPEIAPRGSASAPGVFDYHGSILLRLALLEGSRLEAEGDPTGAWGWYRAALSEVGHLEASEPSGSLYHFERMIFPVVAARVAQWADSPAVDAALLRRALDDTRAIDRRRRPAADAIKAEYLVVMRKLADPPPEVARGAWEEFRFEDDPQSLYKHLPAIEYLRWFLRNETERGRRIARLAFANWLAHCDDPPAARPPLTAWSDHDPRGRVLHLFADPARPTAPASPGGPPPAELGRWYDTTLILKRVLPDIDLDQRGRPLEQANWGRLIMGLAERLYAREHGGAFPPSPEALVGPYLKALPEGYVDPSGESPSPKPAP